MSNTHTLVHEKIEQTIGILQEQNVDLWMTFVRETSAVRDPALDFIYGHDVTWQSVLIFTKSGKKIAIVGRYDGETVQRIGAFDEVILYDTAFSQPLLEVLNRLNPRTNCTQLLRNGLARRWFDDGNVQFAARLPP